jgi:hypothetical protein
VFNGIGNRSGDPSKSVDSTNANKSLLQKTVVNGLAIVLSAMLADNVMDLTQMMGTSQNAPIDSPPYMTTVTRGGPASFLIKPASAFESPFQDKYAFPEKWAKGFPEETVS